MLIAATISLPSSVTQCSFSLGNLVSSVSTTGPALCVAWLFFCSHVLTRCVFATSEAFWAINSCRPVRLLSASCFISLSIMFFSDFRSILSCFQCKSCFFCQFSRCLITVSCVQFCKKGVTVEKKKKNDFNYTTSFFTVKRKQRILFNLITISELGNIIIEVIVFIIPSFAMTVFYLMYCIFCKYLSLSSACNIFRLYLSHRFSENIDLHISLLLWYHSLLT